MFERQTNHKQLKHSESLNADDSPTGHQANETAIISPSALDNMRNSKYLDSWATTETTGNLSSSKLLGPDMMMTPMTTSSPNANAHSIYPDANTLSHDIPLHSKASKTDSDPLSTPSSNHRKKESTIKGGWWKEQEHFARDFGSITTSLSAAKEERNAMMQMLETLQSQMSALSTQSTFKRVGSEPEGTPRDIKRERSTT